MPLYECRCERCELTFEVLAPLSSSGLKSRPCPQCVTQLKVPPPARLCWMDDRSAARYAAYKHGRGAEYDDKMHEREERGKKRGDPPAKTAASAHQHGHAHAPAGRKAKAAKSALKAD